MANINSAVTQRALLLYLCPCILSSAFEAEGNAAKIVCHRKLILVAESNTDSARRAHQFAFRIDGFKMTDSMGYVDGND
jgi:hypothetical protein